MALPVSAVLHAGITYGRFKDWDGVSTFSEIPLFYQGVDEETIEILERLEQEGAAILQELGRRCPGHVDYYRDKVSLLEWVHRAYARDIGDPSSLLTSLRTNAAYAGLAHPMTGSVQCGYCPNVASRYWTEDLPCHLVLAKGVALLLGNVDTPLMDTIIVWMQSHMGTEYMVSGQLSGRDLGDTCSPQRYGLSIHDIVIV